MDGLVFASLGALGLIGYLVYVALSEGAFERWPSFFTEFMGTSGEELSKSREERSSKVPP